MAAQRLEELWLGLDTGGTFTDAVLIEAGREVIAKAKALTTPWDLALGIAEAIASVLRVAALDARRARISLVSVSTTLATNAVVENRFSPVGTLLIGFDSAMVARSGLERAGSGDELVCIGGGHGASGEESQPLDEQAVREAVAVFDHKVEAYAVAANFSVRNPAHELRVRQLIRSHSSRPVTCAHELSSQLDAPRRALTAALNARLTPQIRHLIEALTQVLQQQGIAAPLMIVKGDGSLMRAQIALEYPVETILSGPAASVVGASFLTGLADFVVSDMGGTTTDIAVVSAGRPLINGQGALIGGWRTMVQAVDVRTSGLGGDSEVQFDRHLRLSIGPRKAMPLSLLAVRFPALLGELERMASAERVAAHPAHFALRNPGREAPQHLGVTERRVWEALASEPRPLAAITRSAAGLEALRRLADAGLATIAAFTPTDALHVLERHGQWSRAAAEYGARLLATEERNARAAKTAVAARELCERVHEQVVRESGRALLLAALGTDPGIEAPPRGFGALGERLITDIVGGRAFSALIDARLALARPLVAIGAPVESYYPEIARRLGVQAVIPAHAAVCNAVGAVVGVVAQTVDVLVTQPAFNLFRVHDPAGGVDYAESAAALEHARRVSRELALAAARRAGAGDPHLETSVHERRATLGSGEGYLAEALVRTTATGRPLAADRSALPRSTPG